jgi:dephospho-CoA kinase
LGDLIAQADIVIENEGTLSEFYDKVEEVLDRTW